jgi:zinc transport system permease protein
VSEFFHAVLAYPFLQAAVLAGVLASLACGIVGSYVVVRRINYIAGGIAHTVLGGMGAAYWLNRVHGWTWLEPIHGAILTALLAAAVIGWVSLRARQWEDTIIGALWAIGMAAGVLFMTATPGYNEELMSRLFGNILMVDQQNLWLLAALDVVVVVVGLGLYKQFLSICFDEEFARSRGMNVELYYMVLLMLTALTVVLLAMIVGIVMVIALLALPVGVAGALTRRLWSMMLLGTVLAMVFTLSGFVLSYNADLPPGATIILLAGGVYLLVVGGRSLLFRHRGA